MGRGARGRAPLSRRGDDGTRAPRACTRSPAGAGATTVDQLAAVTAATRPMGWRGREDPGGGRADDARGPLTPRAGRHRWSSSLGYPPGSAGCTASRRKTPARRRGGTEPQAPSTPRLRWTAPLRCGPLSALRPNPRNPAPTGPRVARPHDRPRHLGRADHRAGESTHRIIGGHGRLEAARPPWRASGRRHRQVAAGPSLHDQRPRPRAGARAPVDVSDAEKPTR